MSTTRTLRALLLLVIVTLGVIGLGDRISIPALAGLATRVKAEVGRPRRPSASPASRAARRAATDLSPTGAHVTFPVARTRCRARLSERPVDGWPQHRWSGGSVAVLLLAVLTLSLTAGAACHSTSSTSAVGNPPASNDAPVVLLFTGHGTSPGDVTALERLLSESHVSYATATSPRLEGMSESELRAYRLLLVPGGNFVEIGNGLTSSATAHLRNAIQHGLNYFGVCGGAFFGGNSPYNGLNLTSGVRFGFYAAEARGTRRAAVPIAVAGAPTLEHYWEDGPQLTGWGEWSRSTGRNTGHRRGHVRRRMGAALRHSSRGTGELATRPDLHYAGQRGQRLRRRPHRRRGESEAARALSRLRRPMTARQVHIMVVACPGILRKETTCRQSLDTTTSQRVRIAGYARRSGRSCLDRLAVTNIRTFVNPQNPKRVAVVMDVPDMDALNAVMQSPAAAEAMAHDGVVPETLVILVEA